jgi:hypothetical protein
MNSLKNRLLRLEARNGEHDGDVAELFGRFCESKGYPMPDKLPTGAEVDAIIRSAVGTALRPYSSEGK